MSSQWICVPKGCKDDYFGYIFNFHDEALKYAKFWAFKFGCDMVVKQIINQDIDTIISDPIVI